MQFDPIKLHLAWLSRLEKVISEIKLMVLMGHVTFIILFGFRMEYLGPSMIPPASHLIPKNEIFGT